MKFEYRSQSDRLKNASALNTSSPVVLTVVDTRRARAVHPAIRSDRLLRSDPNDPRRPRPVGSDRTSVYRFTPPLNLKPKRRVSERRRVIVPGQVVAHVVQSGSRNGPSVRDPSQATKELPLAICGL